MRWENVKSAGKSFILEFTRTRLIWTPVACSGEFKYEVGTKLQPSLLISSHFSTLQSQSSWCRCSYHLFVISSQFVFFTRSFVVFSLYPFRILARSIISSVWFCPLFFQGEQIAHFFQVVLQQIAPGSISSNLWADSSKLWGDCAPALAAVTRTSMSNCQRLCSG